MVETKAGELPVEIERPGDTLGLGRAVAKENHGRAEGKHYCRRGHRASSASSTDGGLVAASGTTTATNAVKKLKEREIELQDRNYVDLTADSPRYNGKRLAFAPDAASPELSFLRRHHRTGYNRPSRSYLQEAEVLVLGTEAGQTAQPKRGCSGLRTSGETRNEVSCDSKRADGQRGAAGAGTSSGTYDVSNEQKDKAPSGMDYQVGGTSSGPEQGLRWKRKRSSLTDAGTSRQRFKPPRKVADTSGSSSYGGFERPIELDDLEGPSSSAAAENNVTASSDRARQIEEDELLAKFLQEDYGLEAGEENPVLDDAQLARMLQEEENAKYMHQRVGSTSQATNASILRAASREMQRVLPTIRPTTARPTASSSRMRILRNLHNRSHQHVMSGRRLGGSTGNPSEQLLHFPEGLALEARVEFLAALETVSQGSFAMLDQVNRDFNESDYEMLLALDDTNHSQSGASYNKIERLPISVIKPTDVYTETCSICLETPVVDDVVRRLPCMHGFHLQCIDEWLGRQANCPICKMQI